MDTYPEHPILPDARAYRIERFDWRLESDEAESCIDLTFRKGDERRRLRFRSPVEVEIHKDFRGTCGELAILDIRRRGWETRIQVCNLEPDGGIAFFAVDVVDLDREEGS